MIKSLFYIKGVDINNINLTKFLDADLLAQILGMIFATLFLHYFRRRIIKLLKRVLGDNYQLKGCICFAIFMCLSTFLVNKIPDRPSQKEIEKQQKALKEKDDFLEQLKMAEDGDPIFQDIVGYMYYEGRRVNKDYKQAVYWFRKSAESGYCDGRCDLAFMYYNGYGVQKDYEQAAYWYEKASEHVPTPKAQYSLGNMYFEGKGVKKSISKALELYEAAANAKYSDASQKIGDIYFNGVAEIKRNYEKAIFWYTKSANDGENEKLMYFLGNIYYDGKVVKRDYKKAQEWYLKSANLNYLPSMQKLADMYFYGQGVPQDYQKAFLWHKEVADRGFNKICGRSKLILGDMCYEGLGVEQNYQEALKWYRIALQPVDSTPEIQKEARAKYNKLKEQLNPSSNEGIYQYTQDFNASIAGDKVNIRTEPNTSSKVVKQLNRGHLIKATKKTKGKKGTWYFIQAANGTEGWVFGEYVKFK